MAHETVGPGSTVAARFRLEDLLEEHAGARFWRATDLVLARNVAIHVITADDGRADAVLTAARTSATVSDPHMLRVLDALEEDGAVYVVHEWGSGLSLDRMLAEETLEPRRAAWLVKEVAEAINVAHRHGIAHGRLLPENVLVTDTGAVKLIGFVVDAILHGSPHRYDEDAPASEHEADVRNLGALLYASLTGRWPGYPPSLVPEAPTEHGRVLRPRQVRPGVPKRLDSLCTHILERPAEDTEVVTAADVAAELGGFLGDDLSGAGVSLGGPAAFLDPDAFQRPRTPGTLGSQDGVRAGADGPADGDQSAERTQTHGAASATEEAATQEAAAVADDAPTSEHALLQRRRGPDVEGDRSDTGAEPGPDTDPGIGPSHEAAAARARRAAPHEAQSSHHSSRSLGVGMGAATPPPHWGPDRPGDTGSYPVVATQRPGSWWLRLGITIGVAAAVLLAIVIAFNLGGARTIVIQGPSEEGSPSEQPAATQPVEIAEISDFDPDGGENPEENADLVPRAVDGDPSTAWRTYTYFDGPELAPYRAGVGLLLDLGEETEVRRVRVDLEGGPYAVEVLAAPEGTEEPPTSVEGLETVTSRSDVSDRLGWSADEEAVTSRYLVIWLTALPETSGGYRGGVTEVAVRS